MDDSLTVAVHEEADIALTDFAEFAETFLDGDVLATVDKASLAAVLVRLRRAERDELQPEQGEVVGFMCSAGGCTPMTPTTHANTIESIRARIQDAPTPPPETKDEH